MQLNPDIYGELLDRWVVPIDDPDVDFPLALKSDAPTEMVHLFERFKRKVEEERKKRSRAS